jgi:hypothetical protein
VTRQLEDGKDFEAPRLREAKNAGAVQGVAAFFRRLKAGAKAGFPRFRSRQRYDSLTYPSWGDGCALRPSAVNRRC